MTALTFEPFKSVPASTTVIIGRKDALLAQSKLVPAGVPDAVWRALVDDAKPGDDGATASTTIVNSDGTCSTVVAGVLPEHCSRHNSPVRGHAVSKLAAAAASGAGKPGGAAIISVLESASQAAPAACAIARAFPLFDQKKPSDDAAAEKTVRVSFATADGGPLDASAAAYGPAAKAAAAVRLAARIVDTPPEEMGTIALEAEARAAAERLAAAGVPVEVDVIAGEALRDGGYGGLWGVGKAATERPALVILSHAPKGSKKSVCLVGKGIVYDTGGLSLKPKDGMPGMKADCGGAAALLGAFEAACSIGTGDTSVHLLLCLAENAIGPKALRNDDIIKCLSGLTCEINNTDAEGRLVLADGVAHASAVPPKVGAAPPELIIDMATLTGAQMIATGKRHAGVVANTDEVEAAAVAAGKRSGDLAAPLPYAPEFYRNEFKSKVADMKNSVKDRGNAQASCAANFIGEHLHKEYEGGWLHCDIAGPASIEERGTGFGVALVLGILEVEGFAA